MPDNQAVKPPEPTEPTEPTATAEEQGGGSVLDPTIATDRRRRRDICRWNADKTGMFIED